ncbi:MAG: hypothetical protein Kow0065_17220 [Methylomicrobium sp.]
MKLAFRQYIVLSVLLLSGLSVVVQIWNLYRIDRENEWLERLLSGHDITIDKVVTGSSELRLARAIYLRQKQRYDEALATLNELIDSGDASFQAKVRYNLGNLYLAQAVEQAEAMNVNEALPLAGLAKQAYRQALSIDSQFWDAKYNLEVAMRLLPEMNRIDVEDEPENRKSQLWTTVPGFPRGLP